MFPKLRGYPKEYTNLTGYKFEPWHLRYVGVDLASKLYNDGNYITLEEYLAMSKEVEHLLLKVKLKPNVIDVLNKLKQDGHTLIFITARGVFIS